MEMFKLMSFNIGLRADISINNNNKKIERAKQIFEKDLSHTVYLKGNGTNESGYLLFNKDEQNVNFFIQDTAISYNSSYPEGLVIEYENLEKFIFDKIRKIKRFLTENNVKFFSHPLFQLEFIFHDDSFDYSKALENILLKDEENWVKGTFGITIKRELKPFPNPIIIGIIVEHFVRNPQFLFFSNQGKFDIIDMDIEKMEIFNIFTTESIKKDRELINLIKRIGGEK